jgi:hypothetical protein
MDNTYPVQFSVDYPDRELNRVTTFFRIFTAIPIVIVFAGLTGGYGGTSGITAGGTPSRSRLAACCSSRCC